VRSNPNASMNAIGSTHQSKRPDDRDQERAATETLHQRESGGANHRIALARAIG